MKQQTFRALGYCEECHKYLYINRKAARAVSRQHHGEHKNEYRCPHNDNFWHVGALADSVIQGETVRSRRYRRSAA